MGKGSIGSLALGPIGGRGTVIGREAEILPPAYLLTARKTWVKKDFGGARRLRIFPGRGVKS